MLYEVRSFLIVGHKFSIDESPSFSFNIGKRQEYFKLVVYAKEKQQFLVIIIPIKTIKVIKKHMKILPTVISVNSIFANFIVITLLQATKQ